MDKQWESIDAQSCATDGVEQEILWKCQKVEIRVLTKKKTVDISSLMTISIIFQFPYRQISEYQNHLGVDCMNKSNDLYDENVHSFFHLLLFIDYYLLNDGKIWCRINMTCNQMTTQILCI